MKLSWRVCECAVIAAVALHSFVLGVALMFMPLRSLSLLGWDNAGSAFFVSQAGLFLLILSACYMASIWCRPYLWLLLGSKVSAVLFLVGTFIAGLAPPIVLLTAAVDGAMAAAVAITAHASGRLLPRDQNMGSTSSTASTT